MSKASSENAYVLATTIATNSPDELRAWWKRLSMEDAYIPYKVKQISRVQQGGADKLTFELAGDAAIANPPPNQPFAVDLINDGPHVWSDLPSTIQFADASRPYGFLFLSMGWSNANGVTPSLYAEDGGKWPIVFGDLWSKAMLEALADGVLRTKLLNAINAMDQVMTHGVSNA